MKKAVTDAEMIHVEHRVAIAVLLLKGFCLKRAVVLLIT
jgi:hypothetical protein